MSIDRKRIAAVKALEAAGWRYDDDEWKPADPRAALGREADALHRLLFKRVEALGGCTEGSPEAAELLRIAEALLAYEAVRWPVAGGR